MRALGISEPHEPSREGGRLLVLACSRAKRPDPEPLPALERYDGPLFRAYRRYLREGPVLDRPNLLVLSAAYGLISGEHPLLSYDRMLTPQRARELQAQIPQVLSRCLDKSVPLEVFFCGGSAYLNVLNGLQEARARGIPVQLSTGAPGKRLSLLRRWLYGNGWKAEQKPAVPGPWKFHGREIQTTLTAVVELARREAHADPSGAARFHGWYVEIDGLRVAPKWLTAHLTGIPVSSFRTGEAVRFLSSIGLPVRSI